MKIDVIRGWGKSTIHNLISKLKKRETKYKSLFIISDKVAKYYLMDEKRKQFIFIDPGHDAISERGVGFVGKELPYFRTSPNIPQYRCLHLREVIDDIYIYS